MDPSEDSAGDGGICDVAIDSKGTEDFAMDTGDDFVKDIEEAKLMNGSKDDSDNDADVQNPDGPIADTGFAQFSALNDLKNDEDDNIDLNEEDDDEMMVDNEDDSNTANEEIIAEEQDAVNDISDNEVDNEAEAAEQQENVGSDSNDPIASAEIEDDDRINEAEATDQQEDGGSESNDMIGTAETEDDDRINEAEATDQQEDGGSESNDMIGTAEMEGDDRINEAEESDQQEDGGSESYDMIGNTEMEGDDKTTDTIDSHGDNIMGSFNDTGNTDADVTEASFVTAADKSPSDSIPGEEDETVEESERDGITGGEDQTVEESERSEQQDIDDGLLDDTGTGVLDSEITEQQEESAESPEMTGVDMNPVDTGEDDQSRDSFADSNLIDTNQEQSSSPKDIAEDSIETTNTQDSVEDSVVDINQEQSSSPKDITEDSIEAANTQDSVEESTFDINQEQSPSHKDEDLIETTNIQDSVEEPAVDINPEQGSSPNGEAIGLIETTDTQDSVEESAGDDKDEIPDDAEGADMVSMQALYETESTENKSLDSYENTDSHGSGVASEKQSEKDEGFDVGQFFKDTDTESKDDSNAADTAGTQQESTPGAGEETEMEIESDDFKYNTDTNDTSEPIICEVKSLQNDETEFDEHMDVDTQETHTKETEKSEVNEENIEKINDIETDGVITETTEGKTSNDLTISDENSEVKSSEAGTDQITSDVSEEKENDKIEDLPKNDEEMADVDEDKLLAETEEEKKDDEGEAMETDEKVDEQEPQSEKEKGDEELIPEKVVEETEKSVDAVQETVEKAIEESENTAEETQKSTEESEKLVDDTQKSVDSAEKSIDEKDKTAEEAGEATVEEKTESEKESKVSVEKVTKKRKSAEDKKPVEREASPVVIDDEDDKQNNKPDVKPDDKPDVKDVKEVKKEEKPQGRQTRSSSAAVVKKERDEKIKAVKKEEDDDVIAIKEEKKPTPKPKSNSKIQKCIVCQKVGKCKYNIVRNGDVKHLCDDVCFKKFRSNPTEYLRHATPTAAAGTPKTDAKANAAPAANQNQQKQAQGAPPPVYKTCSVCQLMNVRTTKPFLNWQGLDFCGEECLGKFQGNLSATCSYCASQIVQANRAKFCWRVGTEVKQFCSSLCYSEFIKRLKLCAFCNKDLANIRDSFMAPVGNQGTFKDFCSQLCLAKYEERNAKDIQIVGVERGQKTSVPPKGNFQCQVCGKTGPVKHEVKLDGKQNRLCSDPCLSAFQYANKLTMNTCDNCGTNCYNENTSPQYIQFEGQQKRFCSYMCVNAFKSFNKKTVPCAWCGAKKSNFDMIERVDANNKYQLFCSLNCLSLYRVNLQATSNQAVLCDQCRKFVPAQYHLTMSDASVRNFCSYTCVMQFQAQFTTPKQQQQQTTNTNAARQQQQTTPQQQNQSGLQTRSKAVYNTRGTNQQQKQTPTATPPTKQTARQIAAAQKKQANNSGQSIPIISNVVSLAPQGNQQQINVKSSTPVVVQGQQEGIKTTTTTTGNQTVQQQIIIQPPPPKGVKNKSLLCKPYVQTKATSCKPHTQTKEVQTEGKPEADRYFIPVPIPIYVPTPLAMYSTPTPVMIPVPLPVPVPVFIPTTKKSSGSILKQIKEIQERIPNDPLEAELLMMAEAVAGKDEESSSESEDELPPALPEVTKEPAVATTGQELGEDMLQMALRMASEMSDEPVMDLENSLEPVAVSAVPPTQAAPVAAPASPGMEEEDDTDEYIPPSSRSTRRSQSQGRKRSQPARRGRSKRQKIEVPPEIPQRETTPSPQPAAPPPDANFHLKYTYGVNAWKHWVIAKNAQLENATKSGSNKKLKLFKTDLLQCTADELNFALCLFVKEVRKPNGEEYAVDSIYYLCLGIQQYLFENGRIDNIFTDSYFDKFTDFLNEVLTMYEPKLNTAGQLVCRIEEEHLWESKQLGAHSPHVLLNSLVYFNTKYFMLKTSEDHLKLSFTHIMKHWKKSASGKGSGTGANVGRSVYLRYYCPNLQGKSDPNQKKRKEEMPVYEQTENLENPLRCPVKLYEFYLSKCPESIKNRNDTFYLVPERSCVPDSPVWYSTMTLGIDHMAKMLNRIRLVREIQEAHLHTQPVYI